MCNFFFLFFFHPCFCCCFLSLPILSRRFSCIPTNMKWIEKYFNSHFSLWSFPLLWFMAQLKMLWLNLVVIGFSTGFSFFLLFLSFLLPLLHFAPLCKHTHIHSCAMAKRISLREHSFHNSSNDDDDELNFVEFWRNRVKLTEGERERHLLEAI